nr:hypothetical protein BJQ95_00012 [Cryobacterium sp. SO1]
MSTARSGRRKGASESRPDPPSGSIRMIAQSAGVDPSLVINYFASR